MNWITADWGEIITVFIACAIKPGIAGIPAAVFIFGFNFFEAMVVCSTGGIAGVVISSFLIDAILKKITTLINRYYPERNKEKKKFTKTNRFIVKVKKNFGVIGVSAVAPLLLSLPLGVFLCLKFFGDRSKIIFWMSVSILFWTILLFFCFSHFRNTLEKFFI